MPSPMQPGETRREAKVFWYSVLLVAAQVIALLGFVAISTTQWFLNHDDYPLLKSNLGYSLRAQGLNCDIVLYGDSSPLTGLIPSVIQQRTGLTTCNLSEAVYVHRVVGSYFPLDEYLKHNKRPLFFFSSWAPYEFHPYTQPASAELPAEGVEYAMVYDRTPAMMKALWRHPYAMLTFAIWVGNRMAEDVVYRIERRHANTFRGPTRDQNLGYTRFNLPMQTSCTESMPIEFVSREQSKAQIEAFRRHFAVGGTQVIVDVTPTADCSANPKLLESMTQGLGDNALRYYPVSLFNERGIHFTEAGGQRFSEEASEQILALMRQRGMKTPDGAGAAQP